MAHKYNYELMKRLNDDKQMTDVWRLPAIGRWEKSCGKHPTQKPLSVLTRIILSCTDKGDWIFDPFSGSSTTGIAANLCGRKFAGIEQDEAFCQMSRARREELDLAGVRADLKRHIVDFKTLESLEKQNIMDGGDGENDNVCMGRTHGVHAEPTTFGLKAARWYSEMKRNKERFEHAARGVEAGKISGAVGTFAEIDPFVEKYVCDKLGLRAQEISTQVLPRDLHAEYIATIALIGTSMEEMATEIRSLQRTEIHEVEEHFANGARSM